MTDPTKDPAKSTEELRAMIAAAEAERDHLTVVLAAKEQVIHAQNDVIKFTSKDHRRASGVTVRFVIGVAAIAIAVFVVGTSFAILTFVRSGNLARWLPFVQQLKLPALASRVSITELVPGSGQSTRDLLADGAVCAFCREMVVVPKGTFTMGSPSDEPERELCLKGSEGSEGQVNARRVCGVCCGNWAQN